MARKSKINRILDRQIATARAGFLPDGSMTPTYRKHWQDISLQNAIEKMNYFACLNDPNALHWGYLEGQAAAIGFCSR